MFRLLKFAHVNPFYLLLLFGYGLTRFFEWLTDTTELWSTLWNMFIPFFDRHKFLSYIIGLPVCVITIHWMYATSLLVYECVKKSKSRTDKEPDTKHIKDWIKQASVILLNQLVILPSTMIINLYFLKFANESHVIDFSTIPTFPRMFYRLFVSMIMYEIVNFYVHWMLHHPLIYKQVHKPNFLLIESLGVVNIHQYPIEYILLTVLPPSLALSISRSDSITIMFFMAAIVMGPFFEHYALQLPFLCSTDNEYHYQYCNDCCNPNGVMDFIHGTYDTFMETKNFENHRILLSMKSLERKCDDTVH